MADHTPTGPVQTGAQMDYPEHEKTYSMFIALSKYGTVFCVSLMIAMAFGFFVSSAGFFSALILLVLLCAIGWALVR